MESILSAIVRFLELLFFVGIGGSVLVIAVVVLKDVPDIFEEDAPAPVTTVREG